MHGAQRSVVTGVHRLEHVQSLAASHLPDDDPVGPHAKRVAHELSDRDASLALDVRRPRLESKNVALMELQLGCVFDRDDTLPVRDGTGERVQKRRLTGTRTTGDEDVELSLDAASEEPNCFLGERAEADHVRRA